MNIRQTMSQFIELWRTRKVETYCVFNLLTENDCPKQRRTKVFNHFRSAISRDNYFQVSTVYNVAHKCLGLWEEYRNLLNMLFKWCDLCLPANTQSFAESKKIKIQQFQIQIVSKMKGMDGLREQMNKYLIRRVNTLQSLFSTKKVEIKNIPEWEKIHLSQLIVQECNAYLKIAELWEMLVDGYLLLNNYWIVNFENDNQVFQGSAPPANSSYYA